MGAAALLALGSVTLLISLPPFVLLPVTSPGRTGQEGSGLARLKEAFSLGCGTIHQWT